MVLVGPSDKDAGRTEGNDAVRFEGTMGFHAKRLNHALIAFNIATVTTCGCGTMMNGPTQSVNIQTHPPGAICSVQEKQLSTPGDVVLSRKNDYSGICILNGYQNASFNIKHVPTSSYCFLGNLLFTGLVPGMVYDLISGGNWDLSPAVVTIHMEKVVGNAPSQK